ncbi:unnamed protein product, partial [Symbiodinium sp. KB8]
MRWHTFKSETLTYFVEKKGASERVLDADTGEMSNPARMANWDSEEIQKEAVKVLKKLGFPSTEGPASAGTNLPKILTCLSRRSDKITETQDELAEHKKTLEKKGKLTTTVDRMDAKLTEMFNTLETKSAQVEDLHMTGVVEGWESSPDLIRLQFESVVKECQRSLMPAAQPSAEEATQEKTAPKAKAKQKNRLFKRFGLTVPIPMSFMSIDANTNLPWLKVSDWLAYLLRRSPELVCGGYKDVSQAQHMRQEFWQKFREFQADHEVFKLPDLKNVIPICLHGDKGRGYGKTPMFCFSFECVFGLPRNIRSAASRAGDNRFADNGGHLDWSCGKRAREDHGMQHFNDESCPKRRKLEGALQEMPHNGKGHVFLSHFLVGAISNKLMKEHPQAVDIFLKEMAQDLGAIAREGLTVKGETYHIGLLGVKGDCEFHVECGCFERSYLNVGVIKDIPFCPECDAGSTGVPGFDFSEEPTWAQTLYRTVPWSSMPHINQYVPYCQSCPASLYRRDQFHTLKYGFLKDCGASIIIWLCDLAYFDEGSPGESLSIENRLERAYGLFKLWTLAACRSTTIRKFTKGTLHRLSTFKFPYLSGKGADAVVVFSWLVWLLPFKLRAPKEPEHIELLTA